MITPIETKYNGYNFRSRLEARWAVFFDEIKVSYEYEFEGFNLHYQGKYLPDFYITEYKCFIEIKPPDKNHEDTDKVYKELGKAIELSLMTKEDVYLILGSPSEYSLFQISNGYAFYSNLFLCFSDNVSLSKIDIYQDAAIIAREARFEFGETPKPNGKTLENSTSEIAGLMCKNLREANFCPSILRSGTIRFLKSVDFDYQVNGYLTPSQFQHVAKYYKPLSNQGFVPSID
jgi:hypothetical protein